jgi:hypothetical protein
MNTTKHVVLLTSNIFGRGFDSRRLHHYPAAVSLKQGPPLKFPPLMAVTIEITMVAADHEFKNKDLRERRTRASRIDYVGSRIHSLRFSPDDASGVLQCIDGFLRKSPASVGREIQQQIRLSLTAL